MNETSACGSAIEMVILSLNNSKFIDRISPFELEIKDTTDKVRFVSHIDLHIEIHSEGWLKTKLYNKPDDFSFPIM